MANAILNKRNNEPGFITLLIRPPFLRGLFFCKSLIVVDVHQELFL